MMYPLNTAKLQKLHLKLHISPKFMHSSASFAVIATISVAKPRIRLHYTPFRSRIHMVEWMGTCVVDLT